MKRTEIEYIIRKIFKRLTKFHSQMQKNLDQSAIHNFRVETKMLRAFLRLLSLELKDPYDLRLSNKLTKIYLAAGKVRNLQLYFHKMDDTYQDEPNKPVQYRSLLQDEMKKWAKELRSCLKENILQKTAKRVINYLPAGLQQETIKHFFQQKAENGYTMPVTKLLSDEELHRTRKRTKDIIFVFKLLKYKVKAPVSFLIWDEEALKKATELAHELGFFNDICIALSYLRFPWLNEVAPAEKQQLEVLNNQWKKEKASLKEKLFEKPRYMFASIAN
jgi:CHAD domain-containing protein